VLLSHIYEIAELNIELRRKSAISYKCLFCFAAYFNSVANHIRAANATQMLRSPALAMTPTIVTGVRGLTRTPGVEIVGPIAVRPNVPFTANVSNVSSTSSTPSYYQGKFIPSYYQGKYLFTGV